MMEVRLNNKVYLQADEIVRLHPKAFKEGKKKPRQILQFKRIPQDQYIFGSCVKAGWRVSNETNNKAKLLITKEWLDQYLASLHTLLPPPSDEITDRNVLEIAPSILNLKDNEKFKDANGQTLEIEVRGERNEDGCFFRIKDVATCFHDIRIQDVILSTNSGFDEKTDYIYFYRPIIVGTIEEKKKELFFTYQGMLRYMFVSRNQNTCAFRKWATRVLFAVQMGTIEQKESVAAELLGVSVETVSKFLTACVRDIPMVYMLHLGNVPESIEMGGDRHNFLLFKIGQHGREETKYGFQGRSKGHQKEFQEFRHQMSYLHFVFLDPMYVSEAESRIKEFFSEFKTNYQNKSEVYLIPKSKLGEIKKFFEHLSVLFSGNHTDIQRSWDQFRNDTRTRIHELEVELRHLREIMKKEESGHEDTRSQMQIIIDNLQQRVTEQAETIKNHATTIQAFIQRFLSSS